MDLTNLQRIKLLDEQFARGLQGLGELRTWLAAFARTAGATALDTGEVDRGAGEMQICFLGRKSYVRVKIVENARATSPESFFSPWLEMGPYDREGRAGEPRFALELVWTESEKGLRLPEADPATGLFHGTAAWTFEQMAGRILSLIG